jgi:V/A-type H+/Na+-transporting ATPase subunit I
MHRVAIAAPAEALRAVLVQLAVHGSVELAGDLPEAAGAASDALRRIESSTPGQRMAPLVAFDEPDVQRLETQKSRELLAGEVELDRHKRMAITQKDAALFVGWMPDQRVAELRQSLQAHGAAVVELAPPTGEMPPTLLRSTRIAGPFRLLVDTYGVLPYSDVDPTAFAAIAFIVMFGMMFGDAGHGMLLVLLSLLLARARHGRLARVRSSWPLVLAAGASATIFGVLYGEFFGPTGVVPTLWIAPLAQPLELLKAGLVVGSLLLAVSYLLGAANRWRERGVAASLYAQGGFAGALVFLGIAAVAVGWSRAFPIAKIVGSILAALGMVLVFIGALAETEEGMGGVTRGVVEVMDVVVRIGSNIVSFARLAAFGMTHAALSLVTLEGARHLAGGVVGWFLTAVLFTVGTVLALTLEGMVAAIQALRLEFYELFSRVFENEGRPFTPFTLPVRRAEDMQ